MLVLASIANLFPQSSHVALENADLTKRPHFPSLSRAPWPSAYEGMISWRGVAKKRRLPRRGGIRVKCSLGVAVEQRSWRSGNHLFMDVGGRSRGATRPSCV